MNALAALLGHQRPELLEVFQAPTLVADWRVAQYRWRAERTAESYPTHMILGACLAPGGVADEGALRDFLSAHVYPPEPVVKSTSAHGELPAASWWVRPLTTEPCRGPRLVEPSALRWPLPPGWVQGAAGSVPATQVYVHSSGVRLLCRDLLGGALTLELSALATGPHGPTMRARGIVRPTDRVRWLRWRLSPTAGQSTGIQGEVALVTLQQALVGSIEPLATGWLSDGTEASVYQLPADPLTDVPLFHDAGTMRSDGCGAPTGPMLTEAPGATR